MRAHQIFIRKLAVGVIAVSALVVPALPAQAANTDTDQSVSSPLVETVVDWVLGLISVGSQGDEDNGPRVDPTG
jgi:hypothetical protein